MRKQGVAAVSLVNWRFARSLKGAHLACVTAENPQQSPIYRYKPNPPAHYFRLEKVMPPYRSIMRNP